MPKLFLSFLVGASFLTAGPVSILDFDGLPRVNSQAIPQTYGDRLTNTPNVLVSYESSSNGVVAYWFSGYSNLQNVAWGTVNGGFSKITFTADPGYLVNLASFNIGYWGSGDANTGIFVSDGSGKKLWEYTTPTTSPRPATAPLLTPNVTAEKLVLTWGNSWGIAVDNLTFSQSIPSTAPIPEPGSMALAAVAGAALLGRRYFRR